jgi:ATP-dependent DNA helicase RecG
LFREAGIIEKYGSGIQRITQAFLQYGLSAPVFESLPNGFQVTVYAKVPETITVGVNVGVNELLMLIQENPGINVLEMKAYFKVTQRTVERWVKILKDKGKIEFRGAPKTGGYWGV